MPAAARLEGAMGQVVKEQAQGDTHHQGWREPTVKDERQKLKVGCGQHNREKDTPGYTPLKQLIAPPQAPLKKEKLVIEKSRGNQPQRPKGANDVIRIVLGIIDMGVVL
jgi:hypothetical protein